MDTKTKSVEYHAKGYNCAQSVLCTCGEYTGLDEKTALAVAGGFGGGVRCGEICGAVSGAVMAIGMCNPYNDCTDRDAMIKIATLTKQFTREFKEKYGCIRCIDLKIKGHPCDEMIAYCAERAESIIKENK